MEEADSIPKPLFTVPLSVNETSHPDGTSPEHNAANTPEASPIVIAPMENVAPAPPTPPVQLMYLGSIASPNRVVRVPPLIVNYPQASKTTSAHTTGRI